MLRTQLTRVAEIQASEQNEWLKHYHAKRSRKHHCHNMAEIGLLELNRRNNRLITGLFP